MRDRIKDFIKTLFDQCPYKKDRHTLALCTSICIEFFQRVNGNGETIEHVTNVLLTPFMRGWKYPERAADWYCESLKGTDAYEPVRAYVFEKLKNSEVLMPSEVMELMIR